jgi:hypothetical protein
MEAAHAAWSNRCVEGHVHRVNLLKRGGRYSVQTLRARVLGRALELFSEQFSGQNSFQANLQRMRLTVGLVGSQRMGVAVQR